MANYLIPLSNDDKEPETFEFPEKTRHQVPNFMTKFRCIGSDCLDTCCNGWNIFLDKKTHYAYKNSDDPEVSAVAKHSIKTLKSNRDAAAFSKMKLKKNGNCPLMTDCGLCKVHKNLGEEFLSKTCNTFPRRTIKAGDITYLTAMMACPEATRLCLEDEHAVQISDNPEDVLSHVTNSKSLYVLNAPIISNRSKQIQFMMLEIFGDQSLTLGEQFTAAHITLEKFKKHETPLELPQLTSLSTNIKESCMQLRDALDPAQAALFQFKTFNVVFFTELTKWRENFEALIENAKAGIHYQSNDGALAVGTYLAAKRDIFLPYDNDNRYLLSNFIKNELLGTLEIFIPGNPNAGDQLNEIAARVSAIRFLLICLSAHDYDGFGKQAYIDCISMVCRSIQYNPNVVAGISNYFSQKDSDLRVVNALLMS